MGISTNGDIKKIVKSTQVGHGEFMSKLVDDFIYKGSGGSCEKDIINVQQKVGYVRSLQVNEQQRIRPRLSESNR